MLETSSVPVQTVQAVVAAGFVVLIAACPRSTAAIRPARPPTITFPVSS